MGASPSTPVKFSNPHGHTTDSLPIVCRWTPIHPLFLFLIYFASLFSFPVASYSIPTISPPPAFFLNTNKRGQTQTQTQTQTHSRVDLKVAIIITVSAVLFIFILVMGFLKFLRFKLRRKRVNNRAVAVAPHGDYDDHHTSTTNRSSEFSMKDGVVSRYSWEEINRFTLNICHSQVIGSGGFSTVYLAQFPDSTLGAVKIQCSSERLTQVYKQELDILLRLSHRNIVKLVGYCDDREEGVLVFEYVPNGTLQEKLHGGAKESLLSWKSRMGIAFQLVQAMEYLHEMCSLHIVHGDIKASNILLDEHLNCKLCDFGSAKMGFSSTVLPPSSSSMNRIILGSQGYVDPHYLKTGIASKKTDIYSFGVILLELITGREAFSLESREKLTSIASPLLKDAANVEGMVDSRLDGDFDLEEAMTMASISAMCLCNTPSLRASASDILTIMTQKIPSISFLRFEESSAHTKG